MSRQEPTGKLIALHWTHTLSDSDWLRSNARHISKNSSAAGELPK